MMSTALTPWDWPRYWGVTEAERVAPQHTTRHATEPYQVVARAIDVEADPATVFRWLCQIQVAPYSYDLVDNLGRRSPQTLTPGAERLVVGQSVMIGRIVEVEHGHFFTLVSSRSADRLFGGPIVLTYAVEPPQSAGARARIVVHMAVTARSRPARLRRALVVWGDLVMMRRQLLNLKRLAERDAREVAVGAVAMAGPESWRADRWRPLRASSTSSRRPASSSG